MDDVVVLTRLLVQILIVPSKGMLVKREPISRFPMKLLKFCSLISVAKLNKSFTVYFVGVDNSKIGTKYFGNYVGVLKQIMLV